MTDTASLTIRVDSSGASKATADLSRLEKAAGGTERAAHKLGKAWGSALGKLVAGGTVATAAFAYIKMADGFANMAAKLRLVSDSASGAAKAQKQLFDLAQRTSSDLGATTDLYVKLAQSSDKLRGNQELLLSVTERVSKALVVSGADAQSAEAVIRQFSQAMASGALRGDEFVSVLEGAPRLARAIADGLDVPIGALRKMAAEGELTADRVIKALESQGAVIDREFGEMPLTVSRATQQVRNALTQLIGDTDQAAGASKDLADAIAGMARVLESDSTKRGFAAIVSGIASIIGKISEAIPWIIEFNAKLNEGLGKGTAIDAVNGTYQGFAGIAEYTKGYVTGDPLARASGLSRADQGGKRLYAGIYGTEVPTYTNPGQANAGYLGLPSYLGGGSSFSAVPTGGLDPSKFTSTAKRTAGTDASPTKEKAKATKELTEAEKAYREVMEVNALIDEQVDEFRREAIQTAYEQEKAVERGIAATNDLIRDMEFELSLMGLTNAEREKAIALRYADASATDEQRERIGELADAMDKARATDEWKGELKGLFVDLTDGVGKASDAVGDFFDRLKQRAVQALADKAINALFDMLEGKGSTGGGFWGSLGSAFTSMFGGGRAGGGDVQAGKVYRVGENGAELFAPSQSGRIIPATQGAAQRSLEVQVNLTNKGGEPLEAQHTGTRMDGEKVIVDMVLGAVKGAMAQGKLDGDFARNFGMRRMGVSRG